MTPAEREVVDLLRARARHAAAAVQILVRWSYYIENAALYGVRGGDRRSPDGNPMMVIEKAASDPRTNPIIGDVAREILPRLQNPDRADAAKARRARSASRKAYVVAAHQLKEIFTGYGEATYRQALDFAAELIESHVQYEARHGRITDDPSPAPTQKRRPLQRIGLDNVVRLPGGAA